jgi:hypothetical protein
MGVPDGLERCRVCREYRGECIADGLFFKGATVVVTCLCDGIACPRCGVNRLHRPISDRYEEAVGKVLHVPYLMGMAGCRECRSSPGLRPSLFDAHVGCSLTDLESSYVSPRADP